EVESVIGKAGRADTPTDPAPLEMVETFVNFRPTEFWPKRVLYYDDATRQTRTVLRALEERGLVLRAQYADDRDNVVITATQGARERWEEFMGDLASRRYQEFESELAPILTRAAIDEAVRRFRKHVHWPEGADESKALDDLANELAPEYGAWLAKR